VLCKIYSYVVLCLLLLCWMNNYSLLFVCVVVGDVVNHVGWCWCGWC